MVEFLTYAMPGEDKAAYQQKFPALIEGGSRLCLEAGAKVLKIPYPGSAEACAAITALLWNTTSARVGILPAAVPKLGAAAALVAASVAVTAGQEPLALCVASYAAALVLIGTFGGRLASAAALLVSAAGLVTVFANYVRAAAGVSWSQSAAMTAYGLAIIAAVMVLVERKDEPCA